MTEPLQYATPANQQTRPATVGFMLGVLALGLLVVGGCFMIGIMILQFADASAGFGHSDQTGYWTPARIIFLVLMYLSAFTSFGGGAVLMKRAVQKLASA